jgi:hypothetical protein
MLRRFLSFVMSGACLISIPAAAEVASEEVKVKPAEEEVKPAEEVKPPEDVKPAATPQSSWQTEVHGYFRAPMALGLSSRPNPDQLGGPDPMGGPDRPPGPNRTQVSYGPNRTVDANYYSFAYTRLQEQDWAEVFIHVKKKHVDAAVGWMGYWFQAVGFRNPDAAWAPGLAYVTLDTDFTGPVGLKPNIAATVGAFWPGYGYFEKYDTFTLGRFRQIGEQLKLTVPVNPDLTLAFVHGFGTNRDGSFNFGAPPFYGATTAIDLLTYLNAEVSYKNNARVAVHFNTEWTADPNLATGATVGPKSYTAVQQAHLTVLGAEANLRAPYAGRLWISPSYINVRNGWALGSAGTEVMHSLGGSGIATNYMGFANNPPDSTGSGSMFNFGFLYENTLSGALARAVPHEVTVSLFGLLADASLDLPPSTDPAAATTTKPPKSIKQFKYGGDATVQLQDWLSFMIRYDLVNYDLDHPAYIFSSITSRLAFSSHFMSGERIYLQYSHYRYGDKMVLAGTWPWASPLVAGSTVLQEGPYAGTKPDANVIKVQADIVF